MKFLKVVGIVLLVVTSLFSAAAGGYYYNEYRASNNFKVLEVASSNLNLVCTKLEQHDEQIIIGAYVAGLKHGYLAKEEEIKNGREKF